jgi:hypothetical protein
MRELRLKAVAWKGKKREERESLKGGFKGRV